MPLLHREELGVELIRHLVKDLVVALFTLLPPLLLLFLVLLHVFLSELGDLLL